MDHGWLDHLEQGNVIWKLMVHDYIDPFDSTWVGGGEMDTQVILQMLLRRSLDLFWLCGSLDSFPHGI